MPKSAPAAHGGVGLPKRRFGKTLRGMMQKIADVNESTRGALSHAGYVKTRVTGQQTSECLRHIGWQ